MVKYEIFFTDLLLYGPRRRQFMGNRFRFTEIQQSQGVRRDISFQQKYMNTLLLFRLLFKLINKQTQRIYTRNVTESRPI
jgi:hypothetical protein